MVGGVPIDAAGAADPSASALSPLLADLRGIARC
jgi:hypothetical protein